VTMSYQPASAVATHEVTADEAPGHAASAPAERPARRRARELARLISWAVILGSAILILRALPTDHVLTLVSSRIDGLGPWGPLAFAAAYFLAAILFVPGSALTLAAGALFGLLAGTALVSVASTAAAGASFLIARHLARQKVRHMAERHRIFGAIDRAIDEGGWRIVALLRLSPVVPFSVGNYLYGLTPVRFWPYLIASWVAMLPGTFMYVYLGFAGRTAAGGQASSPWQYVLLGAGLVATIVVSAYVTRLARRALRDTPLPADSPQQDEEQRSVGEKPVLWWVVAAIVLMAIALLAHLNRDRLRSLAGPPGVTLRETYADTGAGARFDHAAFDDLLRSHVEDGGLVDYDALGAESVRLGAYIDSLADADVDSLGRDERLALLINAYNAFTLQLVLDHHPVESIKDIPAAERWDAVRWTIGGSIYSLNQIEHELIRPHFVEPRVHFALVCAAIGCPPLRSEAYTGAHLEEQLTAQAIYVHSHPRWFQLDTDTGELALTALYDWYRGDFEQTAPSIVAYAARYSPELVRLINADKSLRVRFLPYSWKLNSVKNRSLVDAP